MELNEFYALAAQRAEKLESNYWAVEVKITTCSITGVKAEYTIYLPETEHAHGHHIAETPEAALRLIGALPPLEIDDDTELTGIESNA